ncbi:MAG: sigma 54-interacting transcriptional regulator [Lewinellaceae bacterium]|nr:sigma 54-interacting transcriptional regulator [Saprospiraceae bacterium]MCB9339581.1 sigma 54-interacting transcriptional regulator [Lewinellaceae bacterium]
MVFFAASKPSQSGSTHADALAGAKTFRMTDLAQRRQASHWLVENLPYDIFWASEDGSIEYANASFCKSLKYSQKEMERLTMFDVNPTLTPEKWTAHWQTVRQKQVDNFKTTHRRKSGEEYMVEVFALFFSNNGKNLICAIVRDITESSFYKMVLEETEKTSLVGGWKWNLQEGTIIATNQALCIFDAKQPEDLLPAQVVPRFLEQEKIKDAIRQAVNEGTPYDLTLQIGAGRSEMRWVRCTGHAVTSQGRTQKIFGTYQDVTHFIRQEQQLALGQEVIDRATDVIFLWEQSGKLFRFNQSAVRELGFSEALLRRATIFDLDPGITPAWWASHWQDIFLQKSFTMEWEATRSDGSRFPVEITVNLVPFEGRHLNCAILRNITERKKRELELSHALEEIKELKNQLEIENEYLQEEINLNYRFEDIICGSDSYKTVLKKVEQVAPTDSTALITGESGTGKELLARAIHQLSRRKDKPLIKVNCATLPKELIESELFGHRKGAFTGAVADKTGKFELADHGTIFLDEIGELPLDLQPKLLRAIQEGEFDKLGDTKTTTVDVRIIAATNRDLEKMVRQGQFREDLFYRLNVFPIHNLPLRERKEDIPMLAQFFLEKYSTRAGKAFRRISKKTTDALMQYDFPGNIRELENFIERAVIIEQGTTLFPGKWLPSIQASPARPGVFQTFDEAQRAHILQVLFHTKWRVSGEQGAAKILGLNDKTLFAKMAKLGIRKEDYLKR